MTQLLYAMGFKKLLLWVRWPGKALLKDLIRLGPVEWVEFGLEEKEKVMSSGTLREFKQEREISPRLENTWGLRNVERKEKCGSQNNVPFQDTHVLIPRVYEYVTLHSNRDFTDVSKLRILRWANYPRLSEWNH